MSKTAFIFIPLLGGMVIGSIITNIASKHLQKKKIELNVGDCIGGNDQVLKIISVNKITVEVRRDYIGNVGVINKQDLLKDIAANGSYLFKCNEYGQEIP